MPHDCLLVIFTNAICKNAIQFSASCSIVICFGNVIYTNCIQFSITCLIGIRPNSFRLIVIFPTVIWPNVNELKEER